jgi:anti-repressor protein
MNSTALIPVFNGELEGRHQQLCDARDLHTFLGIGRFFSNWIKDRIEQYGFIEGEDFLPVLAKSYEAENDFCLPNSASKTDRRGGHNRVDYHLTIDMAKELAMVENNEKGRQIRRYFIAMEREARESRGATYLSLSQQLAIHRQVPKLLALLKAETSPAIRQTLYAQLCQHCHLLAIPAPSLESVGRSKPENGDLFPVQG